MVPESAKLNCGPKLMKEALDVWISKMPRQQRREAQRKIEKYGWLKVYRYIASIRAAMNAGRI